jgi:hypothetical protein
MAVAFAISMLATVLLLPDRSAGEPPDPEVCAMQIFDRYFAARFRAFVPIEEDTDLRDRLDAWDHQSVLVGGWRR